MVKPINLFTPILNYLWRLCLIPGLLMLVGGCSLLPAEETQTQAASPAAQEPKIPSVDVQLARKGTLSKKTEYVGTTFPIREVAWRSRVEGQILDLNVDVGDRVEQGQIVGRIDNSIGQAEVLEAQAELAALESEVTSLEADVNQAKTQVRQAKIELQQAQSDLARSNQLVKEGAVTQQALEQAQNAVDNARQALVAAQQQVANRNSAVTAAQRRVTAQEALVNQEQQRDAFSLLTAPITGSVLERALEPGDLAQVGDEILQLGDFSQIEVRVEISELERGKIRVGQSAQVKLDAFSDRIFTGEVTNISLAADTTARLIPVEVIIPNPDGRIGRGLLARVNFGEQNERSIIIPETALKVVANDAQEVSNDADRATIFVLQQTGETTTVEAREVKLGDRANSQVEVLAGLTAGEQFVARSSDNLNSGDQVRLSFLSESVSEP